MQKRVLSNRSIVISRVPINTKKNFLEWCEENFESDRGMALKWLWDFFTGVMPLTDEAHQLDHKQLWQEIENIKLSLIKKEPEKGGIKMLDGSKRGGKENE